MLPSNLLITRKWRNTIEPVFAEVNEQNIRIAELLIQTCKDHIGKKKGELNLSAEQLGVSGYD